MKSLAPPYKLAIIAGQLVVGGAENQLYLWLSNLDRGRFQPVVLTLHPGFGDFWEDKIEALEIPVLRVPHRRIRLVRLLDILRMLRPYKPDLIQGWHLFASPYAGAAAKLLRAKSLGGLRDAYSTMSKTPFASALALYLNDSFLANSVSAAQQLRIFRKRKNQAIYAVQNAVDDLEKNDPVMLRERLGRQFGISPSTTWIGSLGRLDAKKRFDCLFRVIQLLREAGADFHFLLVGDGPQRASLEGLVKQLAVTDLVTFAGEIRGGSSWLRAMDIFCFTSLEEGLPNAVMEAAMAGLPVVGWRVPFMEELLEDGQTAWLEEPGNLPALKEALFRLIQSPGLRTELGKAARSHMLEKFSLDRYVQSMTEVYEDVLGIKKLSGTEKA